MTAWAGPGADPVKAESNGVAAAHRCQRRRARLQLGADIVATSYAPTWDELGRLAVVAVVRTFLSYFLDREMEQPERLRAAGQTHARRDPSQRSD